MDGLINVSVLIRGVRPLLMHSAQGADPLSGWARQRSEISKLRSKTEEHHRQLAKLDWYSAYYGDKTGRPIIPASCLKGMIVAGAKRSRQGSEARATIIVNGNALLQHKHPLGEKATIDDFWNDESFRDARAVNVNNAKIIRYRPIFEDWACEFGATLMDIDVAKFRGFLEAAGRFSGLCDNRPEYGLFEVVKVKELAEAKKRGG